MKIRPELRAAGRTAALLRRLGSQRQRLWDVIDRPAVLGAPHRRAHLMAFAPTDIEQMDDIDAAADQCVGHEGPVTPPPQRLCAHDGQPLAGLRPRDERLYGTTK